MNNLLRLDKSVLLRSRFHFIVIVLLGILVYSNTLYSPFLFDDETNIVNNPFIKNPGYFTGDIPAGSTQWSPQETALWEALKTRYLGYLSFALNYRIGGLNEIGYHIVNILIHIVNALLIYLLVVLTFKTPFLAGHKTITPEIAAFFSSLIFVSHPIQTEAVTYVVQRFASLAALFYLLALILYIKFRQATGTGRRSTFYALSLVSVICAMKTKEIAFTLPVSIAVYEWLFFQEKTKTRLTILLPFAACMLIIPLSIMNVRAPFRDVISALDEATRTDFSITRADYLLTQFRVMVTYIRLMFPPVIQNLDYDYPVYRSFFETPVYLSFLFLLSLLGCAVYAAQRATTGERHFRIAAFGIFWFFITLSVESTIFPIDDLIFEHRLYLPSVGFIITIVTIIMSVRAAMKARGIVAARALLPLAVGLVLILGGAAYERNEVWRDFLSLWQDSTEKSPRKARPHYNLAQAYAGKGLFDEAAKEYRTVTTLAPFHADAYNNLGVVYLNEGKYEEASRELMNALRINPYFTKANFNLGLVCLRQGIWRYAARQFKNVTLLTPGNAFAHYYLGVALKGMGDGDAPSEFGKALKLMPDLADVLNNFGKTYLRGGKLSEAEREFRAALEVRPGFSEAAKNLENLQKKTHAGY